MKIHEYLIKHGLTLQDMADRLGVTVPAVRNYRNGRIPRDPEIVRMIVKMTKGEVSYADLYEDTSAETMTQ